MCVLGKMIRKEFKELLPPGHIFFQSSMVVPKNLAPKTQQSHLLLVVGWRWAVPAATCFPTYRLLHRTRNPGTLKSAWKESLKLGISRPAAAKVLSVMGPVFTGVS